MLESYKEELFETYVREKRTMTRIATLVYNEFHWDSFYMKRAYHVSFKIMNDIEELENLTIILSLSSTQIGENICRKVIKIQAKIFPLVDETPDKDPSYVQKCLKEF